MEDGKWVRRPKFEEDWSPFCFIAHRKSLPADWVEDDRFRTYLDEQGSPDLVWVYFKNAEDAGRRVTCPCNLAPANFSDADRAARDWEIYDFPAFRAPG
jgi:hypothetical protein